MPPPQSIITVTLNTAVDRVLEVEDFHVGGHLPAKEIVRYPAGKGINVSRALARLRRDSIATGFVGPAEAGAFEDLLAETKPGRAVSQLLTVRGRTRENITILDPKEHTDTHLRTPGYELTRQDVQRIVSKLGLLAREGATLVFSGSLPPGMDPADFDTLIYVALGRGARVALDVPGRLLAESTSVDLSAEVEASSAVGGAGERKRLWLIKPNRAELAEALQLPEPVDEAALVRVGRRLARRVAWVVITLGAEGALLCHGEGAWRARCDVPAEQVVSTVGCGDCLLAGLLAAQADEVSPEAVLRRGVAVATANALQSGVAAFDAALVEQLAQQTVVEAV